ncbi:MAG: elongation factor P maturation arginine rhamnosyltransferase EarP [Candidatus Gracilibacteria bacterium]|nr:elongation factor P maturation arginine rhamnosyltransferase EarP [Candidatus Gracilibacteria bacterium]
MNLSSLTSIDFSVSVVDNYGDMGFAVNLALSLHERYPNLCIRFFSDDEILFRKFFPENTPEWMEYMPLGALSQSNPPPPAKLLCSFFDYPIQKEYLAKFPYSKTIVSFSYFLLHSGLESLHRTRYSLESGYDTVIHFIPSLLPGGGGIIINPLIEKGKRELLKSSKIEARRKFLECHALQGVCEKKWISVFVYQNTLENIAESIYSAPEDTVFFIFGDDSGLIEKKNENIIHMPFLSLTDYGIFQSLCDANIVRGENSLCQGLISGKPVLWDIYKEKNGAHTEKIEDYLLFLGKQFPEADWGDYVRMMWGFNGPKEQEGAFLDYVSGYEGYGEVFGRISEYMRGECDLVEKLENILKK